MASSKEVVAEAGMTAIQECKVPIVATEATEEEARLADIHRIKLVEVSMHLGMEEAAAADSLVWEAEQVAIEHMALFFKPLEAALVGLMDQNRHTFLSHPLQRSVIEAIIEEVQWVLL